MALSAERNTQVLGEGGLPKLMSYPVLTGVKIWKGSIVVITSAGYAKPAVAAASLITVGIAMETVDNTAGSSGDLSVQVYQAVGCFAENGTAFDISDVGQLCYIYDDQTVTQSSAATSIAGTVMEVTSSGVWVYLGLAASVDGTALAATDAALAQEIVDLAATTSGKGASLIGVYDVGTLLAATTVEAALAEIAADIVGIGVAPQALSGAGACNVTALVTLFTSTGGAQALTLANGTQTGQLKIVHHTVDGGSGVLTPATAGNFATFTLTNIHDACLLQWSGSAWNILLNVGGTVA